MTPDPTLIEQVARALCALNFAKKGAEGEFGTVDDCWWAFVDDARAVLTTLQGSAALPSDPNCTICDGNGTLVYSGPVQSACSCTMRATTPTASDDRRRYDSVDVGRYRGIDDTPTAPVQDDDAELRIVFDGPPAHESGRFVECETADGKSINAGTWHERPDGFWELRIPSRLSPTPETGLVEALKAADKRLCELTPNFPPDVGPDMRDAADIEETGAVVMQIRRALASLSNVLPDEV